MIMKKAVRWVAPCQLIELEWCRLPHWRNVADSFNLHILKLLGRGVTVLGDSQPIKSYPLVEGDFHVQ